jgi:hypothetical protein
MIICIVFTITFSSTVGCVNGKVRNRTRNEKNMCFKLLFTSTSKFFWEADRLYLGQW